MKVLILDTREKKNAEVVAYLKLHKIPFIEKDIKVESGDYIYWDTEKKIFDYSTVIDLKKDLLEVYSNISYSKKNHERFKREIKRARELGCNRFVVLIREPLNDIEDVKLWKNRYSKKSGESLYKTMKTFESKYGVEWQFCSRLKAGKRIIEILDGG